MVGIVRWNLSPETRARFTQILNEASRLGIDRDDVVAGGLPGLRALIALKQASQSIKGKARDRALADVQDAVRTLQHRKYPKLVSQFQARVLALQGRGNDTEVAHVARGELVVPEVLQSRAVLAALWEAAVARGIPVEKLRVGSSVNTINPDTGSPEFTLTDAMAGQSYEQPETDEAQVQAKTAEDERDPAVRARRVIRENPVWQGAINQKDKDREGDGSFGSRRDPARPGDPPRAHQGIDIQGTAGEPVYAAGGGTVTRADGRDVGGYGNQVVIDHGDGVVTQVGHLHDIYVKPGDTVRAGQAVGRMGRSGNAPKDPRYGDAHAHFEVRVDGVGIDPGPLVPGLDRRLPR